ncbi:hypothetical protein SLNWT_4720 [Streptomyces albus]|uniref:Uncharacterized protein n=2 Tax=Streptomyces TaxID=1883 RepID=A0A0B5F2H1_STRA4|nr:hypothetical protein SLNWT_4720 [Streptomyces albus]AOU79403.1 hypothetical protein SLNHY_4712 [Streptomyces albus]AYN35130.1 hypothetical protein DUI70_4632 [Streptomyces albus]
MEPTLSAWRRHLPEDFPFDYSLNSLDILEEVLLDRYPDRSSVKAPENSEFTEGAVRYLGETWRRNVSSRWLFYDTGPDDQDIYNRVPLVCSNVPSEHDMAIVPLHTLIAFAVDRERGMLREMISLLTDSIEEAEQSE